jgi:hypothetical protein
VCSVVDHVLNFIEARIDLLVSRMLLFINFNDKELKIYCRDFILIFRKKNLLVECKSLSWFISSQLLRINLLKNGLGLKQVMHPAPRQ